MINLDPFNPTDIVIDGFVEHLEAQYLRIFGNMEPMFPSLIRWVGHMCLESMANSDGLYHNLEHSILVTAVGMEILKGKQATDGKVTPHDWLHFIISLLCHDIGYVRGMLEGDAQDRCVIDQDGATVVLKPGATDASLTPYHVKRGELFVSSRFSGHRDINLSVVLKNIEYTQFPVPEDSDPNVGGGYPDLVRAADLIGQLSDPNYMNKLAHLFYEFKETGVAEQMGYQHPDDLRTGYPRFYWTMVRPYIGRGLRYLNVTQTGKQWISNLHAHVFTQEQVADQIKPID